MTIAQLFNQNSFLIGSGLVLGVWLAALSARRARRRFWLAWIAAVAAALGIFLTMRTAASLTFAAAADVQRAIAAGRPTLVEFYSDL